MGQLHTIQPGPLGEIRKALGGVLSISLALALTASAAMARSTLTARFSAPVAGPGIEQKAELVLDLFPGDGEAVLGATVSFAGDGVQIESAACALGGAEVAGRRVDLDYTEHPLGERATDTLTVVLRAASAGTVPVDVTLLANVDTPGVEPHRARVLLDVEPPLRLRAALSPREAYPGEAVELTLSVTNEDDRGVDAVVVEWPAGITAGEAPPESPIAAGETSEHRWPVRLEPHAAGDLPLVVRAEGGGLRASPVAVAPLRVRPVPVFAARVPGGLAVRGQPARLALLWSNPGGEAIPYEELSARVSAGFAAVPGGAVSGGVEIAFEEDAVDVRLYGPGELAPGEDRSVELDLTPTGTGPFAWTGGFRPPRRQSSLDLGLAVVPVVAPAGPQGELVSAMTDLELVSQGLRAELETAIDAIPLPRGAAVSLATEEEDDADWVVEGLVTRGLLRRGVRVLARDAPHVLRYRVADARVVYSTAGSSFGLFGSARRREARAVVYLRLEDAGQRVLWVRRLDGRQQDPAVSRPAGWLSAGEGFPQSRIEPDRRYLELGLSGAIVGGLLFIFFAP